MPDLHVLSDLTLQAALTVAVIVLWRRLVAVENKLIENSASGDDHEENLLSGGL